MSGVNKCIIIGNLCKDVEVRFLPNGSSVANMTVATSEKWKDKQSGEQKEKSEFHRIVIYKRLAEIAGEYLKKGSKVYLEGKLQTRKWQNQQGQDQYTTEIVCHEMQMLDSKPQGVQQQGGYAQHQQQAPRQQHQQGGYQQQPNKLPTIAQQEQQGYNSNQQFDDSIPF